MEAGLPHPNQSAYKKCVCCADTIFATQEVINRYLQVGGEVYMCLYHLEKAFDSIEFSILLKRLFDVGVKSVAYTTKWVHRRSKFCMPESVCILSLCSGSRGATGVHSVTSVILTGYAHPVRTTAVSPIGKQHACG